MRNPKYLIDHTVPRYQPYFIFFFGGSRLRHNNHCHSVSIPQRHVEFSRSHERSPSRPDVRMCAPTARLHTESKKFLPTCRICDSASPSRSDTWTPSPSKSVWSDGPLRSDTTLLPQLLPESSMFTSTSLYVVPIITELTLRGIRRLFAHWRRALAQTNRGVSVCLGM